MIRHFSRLNPKQYQVQNIFKAIVSISLFCFYSCSKDIPSTFEVVGMRLSNCNNADELPSDATTDSIPKDAYVIKITLDEVMLNETTTGDPQDNGFINDDNLTSLQITSLNNFDASHLAEASLNSYFLTKLSSSATIDTYVSNGHIGSGIYEDGHYINNWSTQQYLYLMTPPSSSGSQSFVVAIGFSDGRTLSDSVNVTLY